MGKSKYVLGGFLFVLGFLLILLFWPKNEQLPVLGSLENYYLEDASSGTYSLTNDKVKVVTFFYTRCPDICPLTMTDFTDLQTRLKEKDLFGKHVELVAITFDFEHDTEDVLRTYAERFSADSEGWKWLRGDEETTERLADDLRVQYKRIDAHFFSHSTTMFLIDQSNQVRALYDMAYQSKALDKEKILADITALVN